MRKIAFPFEDGADGQNAFVYAAKIAQAMQSGLILLHTFDMPNDETLPVEKYNQAFDTRWQQGHEHIKMMKSSYLQRYTAIGDQLRVLLEYRIKPGVLLPEVFWALETECIDLLVMCLQEKLVANANVVRDIVAKVLNFQYTDLLLIPENCYYLHFDNIAILFDYRRGRSSAQLFERVCMLAGAVSAQIHFLEIPALRPGVAAENLRDWLRAFSTRHSNVIRKQIDSPDAMGQIEFYCKKNDIDMLIIPARKQGFFSGLLNENFVGHFRLSMETPIYLAMDSRRRNAAPAK